MESVTECLICSSIALGGVTPRFKELFPDSSPNRQILFQNKSFFLIPDDSPITQDHLLLVSKKHFLSCACLPSTNYSHFLDLKKIAQDYLTRINPDDSVLFFEHGAGKIKNNIARCGACLGVDHAHMHALPIPKLKNDFFQYLTAQIESILKTTRLEISPKKLLEYKNYPYLYLEENGKIRLFIVSPKDAYCIPSQYIRRLLSPCLNLKDYDWDLRHLHSDHRNIEIHRVRKTLNMFKSYYDKRTRTKRI